MNRYSNKKVVYFIPIKEHSQRIPAKNFKILRNKPLYSYIIDTISFGDKTNSIYIDTDTDIILEAYKNQKYINAYRRNNSLIGDDVSMNLLISDFIEKFNLDNDTIVCQLHVTNPFISYATLTSAIQEIGLYDSVVSCNIIQNRLWTKQNSKYQPLNHDPSCLLQTQDLPYIYQENSCFYIFTVESFKKQTNRVGSNPMFYPINFPENIDIDNMSDWDLAEKVLS